MVIADEDRDKGDDIILDFKKFKLAGTGLFSYSTGCKLPIVGHCCKSVCLDVLRDVIEQNSTMSINK